MKKKIIIIYFLDNKNFLLLQYYNVIKYDGYEPTLSGSRPIILLPPELSIQLPEVEGADMLPFINKRGSGLLTIIPIGDGWLCILIAASLDCWREAWILFGIAGGHSTGNGIWGPAQRNNVTITRYSCICGSWQ